MRSGVTATSLVNASCRFLRQREQPSRILREQFAMLGWRHLIAGAVTHQQRATDQFFEPPNLLAHRGLCAMHALAGTREAAFIDNADGRIQQVEIKHDGLASLFAMQLTSRG